MAKLKSWFIKFLYEEKRYSLPIWLRWGIFFAVIHLILYYLLFLLLCPMGCGTADCKCHSSFYFLLLALDGWWWLFSLPLAHLNEYLDQHVSWLVYWGLYYPTVGTVFWWVLGSLIGLGREPRTLKISEAAENFVEE